jgi:hypothetical protein
VIKYIEAKRKKGCSEQHIHEKLEKLELKVCLSFAWRVDRHWQKLQFMHIESLHPAWRDARASFQLRRSDHIPLPRSIIREHEKEKQRQLEWESSSVAPSSPVPSSPWSSSTFNYTSSPTSTRPSSVPSIASVLPTSNSPSPLNTSKQDHRPSCRDTTLSLLSQYSEDSEPDIQMFISPSGNPQN